MQILANPDDSVFGSASSPQGEPTWQQIMKNAVRTADTLLEAVGLDGKSVPLAKPDGKFPVFVPQPYLQRIEQGNPSDPLLRQVLPLAEEDFSPANFVTDPLSEGAATLGDGLLQKYQGRVLVVTTGACAIHCRYCFRRHFPYQTAPRGDEKWQATLEQISGDPTVNEVILSGGDPLTLADEKLAFIFDAIAQIKHLRRIRIHTRLPIVIPQRVTDRLLELMLTARSQHNLQITTVVHSNHPNEIDEPVTDALKRLNQASSQLLNQSVLLAGVNDTADALVALSQKLLAAETLPYYLHQLDRVQGASHFEVDIETGKQIIQQMRGRLPGFGVPRYVQEIAGEASKTVIV